MVTPQSETSWRRRFMLGASTILLRSSHLKFDRLVYVLNHIDSSYCCAEMALQRYTVLPDFHDLPSRIEEVTEKLYTEMLAKEEGVIKSYNCIWLQVC